MTNKDKHDLNKAWLSAQGAPVGETPTCDLDKYREHVEDFDLSEEDQTELLQILWSIMAAFVNLGFGVDSVQLLKTEASEPEPGSHVRKETDHDK